MIRYYIMPIVSITNHRGPKYFSWRLNQSGIEAQWSMMDYGMIDACMVAADVTQAQHDSLVANSDCVSPPENIDQNVQAAAISTIQTVLEALRIPAGWVTTSLTYRQVLRVIAGLFQFAQRYHGMHNEDLIPTVAALDLQWNQLPQARRTRVQATVADLGYNTAGITNQTTVRAILWNFAQQWGTSEFKFGIDTL